MLIITLKIVTLKHLFVNCKHHYDNVTSLWLSYLIEEVIRMIADKIKFLREQKGLTQTELSKKLGITRSSVNAWEMGISVPSTQYIVELANIFSVSTDYLLGVTKTSSIDTNGLNDKDIEMVYKLVEYLKTKN